jgi:hypothetical protein
MAGFYYFTFVDESILWRIRIYAMVMEELKEEYQETPA